MALTGTLPWSSAGSGTQGYQAAYNSALGMNESNYNNMMAGYNQTMATQTTAQQAIQAGYSNLYNTIMGQVQQSYAGQQQQIQNQALQTQAQNSQQLIDRGLGNTTIQSSVNQGVNNQLAQQQQLLVGQEAGQMAQYGSNLGLAGLNYMNQAVGQNTSLAEAQLGMMNSANFGYPNAANFANVAHGGIASSGYGGQSGPQLGYVPSGTAGQYSGSGSGSVGGGSFGAGALSAASNPAQTNGGWNVANPYYGQSAGSSDALSAIGGGMAGVAAGLGGGSSSSAGSPSASQWADFWGQADNADYGGGGDWG